MAQSAGAGKLHVDQRRCRGGQNKGGEVCNGAGEEQGAVQVKDFAAQF